MNRVIRTLRSMRFANILLALVALLSALSSLLPQGRGLPYYAEHYPESYLLIYRSHFYDVFKSWYFVLLMGLLCLSLLLCTFRMLRKALRRSRDAAERAAAMPDLEPLAPGELEKLRLHMAAAHCREEKRGEVYIFQKNRVGRWGPFLLHLAILLVVAFGFCALYLPKMTEIDCYPGESVTLEDGTAVAVDSFSVVNESGQLDYASVVRITLPDGRQSGPQTVRINYPMTFGAVKVFQWTCSYHGVIVAQDRQSGAEQRFYLDELSQLVDESTETGFWYKGVAEARDEENPERGSFPVYQIRVVVNGMTMPGDTLIPAGESLEIGDWSYRFEDPYYPGLRIKQMPFPYANSLLEAAFVLLLVGMVLCFFWQPVLVRADETGYTVAGPRPEKMRLELERLLRTQEGGNEP